MFIPSWLWFFSLCVLNVDATEFGIKDRTLSNTPHSTSLAIPSNKINTTGIHSQKSAALIVVLAAAAAVSADRSGRERESSDAGMGREPSIWVIGSGLIVAVLAEVVLDF